MSVKKILSVLMSFTLIFTQMVLFEESLLKANALSVSASAAIVYCPDNGEIIYENNIHNRRAIASITKIMTAVIALEQCGANDIEIKFTSQMYAEGSSMYLQEGDILRLSELVKGMMSVSGNDAANAIAIGIAGSKEKFADMMNEKAQRLKMNDTHFVTPSGLDDEEHYSSAYDMAVLCAYAMEMDSFREIVSKKNIDVNYIYPENKTQRLTNHNKLLSLCEGCIGIKTGFTKKAGRTLTSCAERDGIRLITVTLNDGNDWNDHCALYDYGFAMLEKVRLTDSFEKIPIDVVGSLQDYVYAVPKTNVDAALLKGEKSKVTVEIYAPRFLYAPISSGDIIGSAVYMLNGRKIGETELCAAENIFYPNAARRLRPL